MAKTTRYGNSGIIMKLIPVSDQDVSVIGSWDLDIIWNLVLRIWIFFIKPVDLAFVEFTLVSPRFLLVEPLSLPDRLS